MTDSINLIFDKDGFAREYDDTYDITIHCESQEEQDAVLAKLNRRWIPCSERLPEAEYGESDNVLTTCIYKDAVDGYRSVKTLYYNGGVWCYPTGETFEGKVLAWMPLPEPYGGESE